MHRRLVFALCLVVACGGDGPTTPVSGDLPYERALWQRQRLRNYDFGFGAQSEWFGGGIVWVVEVRNGVVARVLTKAGDTVNTSQWYPPPPTIDSLFERAIRFGTSAADAQVDVKFDRVLHYPRWVYLDRTGWADDAVWFLTEKLVRR